MSSTTATQPPALNAQRSDEQYPTVCHVPMPTPMYAKRQGKQAPGHEEVLATEYVIATWWKVAQRKGSADVWLQVANWCHGARCSAMAMGKHHAEAVFTFAHEIAFERAMMEVGQ